VMKPPLMMLSLVALSLCAARATEAGLVEEFRTSGWGISRKLLETDELQSVASILENLLSEHGRRAFGDDGSKEVRFTFAVHELDSTVNDFVAKQTSTLWQEAAKLAGTQDLCILMDRGFSKDPGDPETHWHRDDEAIGLPRLHSGVRTVHAWIPLVAMNKDFGTLRYLLGTHRREYSWFEELLASLWGWEFAWFATARIAQDDHLQFGDVAWHDGWTLHSAGSNKAEVVRNGFAISYAYCVDPRGCSGATRRTNSTDATCRAAERLFDKTWRERHRSGENDYSKTMITDPVATQATRFILRSVVGALCGLGIHALMQRCRNKDGKNEKAE